MYITNLEEVVPMLRERLEDYLTLKLGIEPGQKKFKCFLHEDNNPSMYFNPKTGRTTVHCFSCGGSADIFEAASRLDGMPSTGPQWVTETIPFLAELLDIAVQSGTPGAADKEKLKLYRLGADIANILATTDQNQDYLRERGWITDEITIGSISEEELISQLLEQGWDTTDLITSLMIRTQNHHFFGEDKVTFVIRDFRGRVQGFTSRVIDTTGSGKYINSAETPTYHKRTALLGLNTAMTKGQAKSRGLYVVEGPGDLAQLYRLGIYNAVAICGTALTKDHLDLIKMLGISTLWLCLDWDSAGAIATQRILRDEFKEVRGISVRVLLEPETAEIDDVDSLLKGIDDPDIFNSLTAVSGFEWMIRNTSDNQDPTQICEELIPTIATEITAIRREKLARILSSYTNISLQSIMADVELLRSGKLQERKDRLLAVAKKYVREVEADPDNIRAIMSKHDDDIAYIEKDFQRDVIGPNYQLSRFDSLQTLRNDPTTNHAGFTMKHLSYFAEAMAGGMAWTNGALIYLGGRANSGKTATGLAIAIDIAMSDPDAMVLIHSTDDSYRQIEPRLKTNIAQWLQTSGDAKLTIGMANDPHLCVTQGQTESYYKATDTFRNLLQEERLIIVDSEDGSTLSVLERNMRYLRSRYPDKKFFVFCDNTHNYRDYPNLDQTSRIRQISTQQKDLTGKYGCCMMATVEYRKDQGMRDTSKMYLPYDDMVADARSCMYRPNVIIHVYNDSHDRKEEAEIFWKDPARPELTQPRLMLIFSKNKLSEFKVGASEGQGKLIMDLDVSTVAMTQKHKEDAYAEFEAFKEKLSEPTIEIDTNYNG